MPNRTVQITELDRRRIVELLVRARISRKIYEELEQQIERAHVMLSDQIDPDIVRMNTKILVTDMDTRTNIMFPMQVVFPGDADIDENKVSVLSFAGIALLGSRVGDTVRWYVPEHARLFTTRPFRHIKIEEIVQQPEAAEELFV
jgi:regulator of nucleoside diphosphate kinase